jgi:SAM-dependent methyltransferase
VLSQHQAALTLLQSRLSNPAVLSVAWLDLACGRGQILASLDKNLSGEARRKIRYFGYDLDQDYARETEKMASKLGFASLESRVGDLADFGLLIQKGRKFDFITLTNTVHEVASSRLAGIFGNALTRLATDGTLFVYDMETIKPPELGALPWSRDDIRRIVHRMLDGLGAKGYRPEVGLWGHKTTDGWSVQIERQHLGVSYDELSSRLGEAIEVTSIEIDNLLRERLGRCQESLENLTIYGAETAEEQDTKDRLLYEFWALNRATKKSP